MEATTMEHDSINIEDIKFNSGCLGARDEDVRLEYGLLVVRAYSLENGGYHNTYCLPCKSMSADTIRLCLDEGTKVANVRAMFDRLTP